MNDIKITDENFNEYFFDVRTNEPKRGQIMACYSAIAFFGDGNEKRQILDLLMYTDKMVACAQVMRKLLLTSEVDSYRIPRLMAQDLASGMSRDEVARKEYKFVFEMMFYTEPQHVPQDDPHWKSISLLNLNEFLDKKEDIEESVAETNDCKE